MLLVPENSEILLSNSIKTIPTKDFAVRHFLNQ